MKRVNKTKETKHCFNFKDSIVLVYVWEQYWTSPGDNTPRDTNCTATCLPSRKLYKLDEPESRTLLEKQGRAHKWCTPMDPHIWLSKSRTTSSNLHTAAMWGCNPEDLPEAMNNREKWRERVRDIRAGGTTWWWWWWWWGWYNKKWAECSPMFRDSGVRS